MRNLTCPKCHKKMEAFEQLGVEIDQCNECGGVWLDCDEAAKLTRGRGKDAVTFSVVNLTPTEFPCPRCALTLEEGSHCEHADFIIDHCVNCGGSFFDRGEMARLLQR